MKVRDLVKILSKMNQDAHILGYADEFSELYDVKADQFTTASADNSILEDYEDHLQREIRHLEAHQKYLEDATSAFKKASSREEKAKFRKEMSDERHNIRYSSSRVKKLQAVVLKLSTTWKDALVIK